MRNLSKLLKKEMDSTVIVGIYGKPGAGKSIYAMKTALDFYGDWDKVLSHIVFTPFDFEMAMEYLEKKNKWIPLLIWDDAGPWLELLKHNPWHPLAIGIRGIFETMRLRVGAILITMTSERSMPRGIKYNGNIYRYRVKVVKNGSLENGVAKSIAIIQVRREKMNDWEKYYWDTSTLYRDHFTLKMERYNEYEDLRKLYIELYTDLVEASKEIPPAKLLDYVYNRWLELKDSIPGRAFYER